MKQFATKMFRPYGPRTSAKIMQCSFFTLTRKKVTFVTRSKVLTATATVSSELKRAPVLVSMERTVTNGTSAVAVIPKLSCPLPNTVIIVRTPPANGR